MVHSRYNKKFRRNKKGFSTVVATIFMVMAVLFLYFNVFMFMQNQNTKLQDATSQSTQLDADRNSEQISFINVTTVPSGANHIIFSCNIVNNGPLPVEIISFWAKDTGKDTPANEYLKPNKILLQPGSKTTDPIIAAITVASTSNPVSVWFVTSRGNVVPVETTTPKQHYHVTIRWDPPGGGDLYMSNWKPTLAAITYPFEFGTEVTFGAVPRPNFAFDYWIVDQGPQILENTLVLNITRDCTLTAVFKTSP